MRKQNCLWILLLVWLAACAAPARDTQPATADLTTQPPAATAPVQPTVVAGQAAGETELAPVKPGSLRLEAVSYEPQSLPMSKNDWFAGSGVCAACHSNLKDAAGEDVSIGPAWRATMMANAARDPYWLATVRSEVLDAHRELRAGDRRQVRHLPHADGGDFTAAANSRRRQVLAAVCWPRKARDMPWRMDGVSCNLCHQIDPDNFGEKESFSGHYLID